ncbi:MAG: 2-deoxycytidine 5-triphosphate deaminase [Ponticaulis sp.]|nr:2-deoxycytidine 5-triphosphate deaminase [Ponticaulis sp.]
MSFSSGILADHQIETLIAEGFISSDEGLEALQVQPASLDLRLGTKAYRLRASFLPNGRAVEDCLTDDVLMHTIDLTDGAVLETGCVYLVPLQETITLPTGLTATANPKSSTGRIDVFVRLIADGVSRFDGVPDGYSGPLYAEVSPRTYSVLARPGDRLLQMRFRSGKHTPTETLDFSVHLEPLQDGLIGYRARRHSRVLDLSKIGGHPIRDYWEPVYAQNSRLILDPDEFYILASKEFVTIPVDRAAEMAPIAPDLGEFRAHYAGFFDPGFGCEGVEGRAVLEVRGRDVPFVLEHGQPVGRLVYEVMSENPRSPYGGQGSNYQGQGLKLSKHFG